ncbi:FAD-dependent oxidoreductase [Paenibacillus sp. PAMC21692]|uniref:FAD-dependent oxidoreductase n=1 Tax=Paenibacillus sp. PAMC21692 TaxID=2762320 RepID=UPI00164D8FC3|nr:FAD-dependent oxidoreductase [Paenibacillus sp. PAMC21692]QNK56755.1 FAD-dependent oxidoreductase [Paenibacillus sp. PAMC21692]
MMRKKRTALLTAILLIVVIAAAAAGWIWYKERNNTVNRHEPQALLQVESITQPEDNYDVIVAGTDPEGIVAAISAARNDQRVLLVDGRNREILGGLMTLGWLNSLDLNYSPEQSKLSGKHNFLNKGIFQEWYDMIEGTSFDVNTAANAFYELVKAEPNIDLLMKTKFLEPIMETGNKGSGQMITGLRLETEGGVEYAVRAGAVIDATQDGDIAAAAGVPYSVGREDIGRPQDQQAVTLVFKMSGVTQQVWDSFANIGDGTGIDSMSAWGFIKSREYVSSNPERVGIRALNVGRQNDDTILINAMHIFGIDPLNPESVQEALEIGAKEAPLIVDYLKKTYKELKDVEYAGVAPELYVRETRHFEGEYRLTAVDVVDNRDFKDAIAYGSYRIDIQRLNAQDQGAIVAAPERYGVPFRAIVPLAVDNLLVVGRAASFDTIPHGSARVIPLGMATGEAAGAATKLAAELGLSFRELSRSEADIAELRKRLMAQGMELAPVKFETPEYAKHKHYQGLLAAVSMALTFGGDHNETFNLDGIATAGQFANIMQTVKIAHADHFLGNPYVAIADLEEPAKLPLTLEQLAYTIALTTDLSVTPESALDDVVSKGWLAETTLSDIEDSQELKVGEVFSLVRDLMEFYVGKVYS